MSPDSNTPLPKQPRRTWRQWSKRTRVRIGFVLMLIVAISAFSWWWPRRGMVAVAWIGGDVGDPQIVNDIRMAARNLPIWVQNPLWSTFGPYMGWLSTDDRIAGVDMRNVSAKEVNLATLNRFPQLNNLVLHGRHIGPGLTGMKGLYRLKQTWIDQLQTTSNLGELRHLPSLVELDIATCPVTGGGFEELPLLPKLKSVLFDDPPNSFAMIGIGQCDKLEKLIMQSGVVDEDALHHLIGMTGLRELRSFGKYSFGAVGLKHISHLSSLEFLVLNGTSASDDELQVLATLTKLKTFYVRGSNLTQGGISSLQEALPDCKIDWQ